jgi:hypothetical protein
MEPAEEFFKFAREAEENPGSADVCRVEHPAPRDARRPIFIVPVSCCASAPGHFRPG